MSKGRQLSHDGWTAYGVHCVGMFDSHISNDKVIQPLLSESPIPCAVENDTSSHTLSSDDITNIIGRMSVLDKATNAFAETHISFLK